MTEPVIDREALVEFFKWHADPNSVADHFMRSFSIEDKREAQAEALEQYADNRWGKRGPDRFGMNGIFYEELLIRERAAEIREGRA